MTFFVNEISLVNELKFFKEFLFHSKKSITMSQFSLFFFYHNKIILSEKGEIISNMYIFGFDFDVNICFASKYHDILIFFFINIWDHNHIYSMEVETVVNIA